MNFHSVGLDEAMKELGGKPTGLTANEMEERLGKFGKNVLLKTASESILKMLWRQIKNPLIYILIFSSILAIALGKTIDGLVVIAVVVINTLIGFIQEYQASKTINSLMNLVPLNATALRDGQWRSLVAESLVPGDVVRVISGDKVPADIRLIDVKNLKVDESALTGESVPVEKKITICPEDAALGDRINLLYSGTYVTYGQATGMVFATGSSTTLGKIHQMMETSTELDTPLTKSLDGVGKVLTVAILVVSAILFFVGILRDVSIGDSVLNAITLAVAAIPEGLPAIVTIALAIGVRRMAKKNAIIRKLPAVETLGSATIICSDKTGTLTRNEMTVQSLFVEGNEFSLSGIGYNPEGEISPRPNESELTKINDLVLCSVLCNDASISPENGWKISGDPTEVALVVAGHKLNIVDINARKEYPKIDYFPFESENKFMGTLNRFQASNVLILKGAPEVIGKRCQGIDSASISSDVSKLASKGLRVLAVARKNISSDQIADPDLESDFEFLGLIGMMDPPREEAIKAIANCHSAGITVKMITGDHGLTASAIGKELNITQTGNEAITGSQLSKLSIAELEKIALENNVFARVAPEHKLQIVKALQQRGHVVAMTGDGVNDAPALKQANIGVAMGITGTDVSKEAADMILKDDNFSSIVAAIKEGRRVYDNLIKSLMFVLPTNLGLAVILIVTVIFFPENNGIPIQSLLPIQALWINMITTVTLALPLAFELAEKGIMERPPRKQSEPLLGKAVITRTITSGLLMGAASIGLFLYEYKHELPIVGHATALAEAQTISVTSIVFFQIFYLIHCRSFTNTVRNLNVTTNLSLLLGIVLIILLQLAFIYLPFMNELFHSAGLNANAWIKTLLVSVLVYPAIALEKFLTSLKK